MSAKKPKTEGFGGVEESYTLVFFSFSQTQSGDLDTLFLFFLFFFLDDDDL